VRNPPFAVRVWSLGRRTPRNELGGETGNLGGAGSTLLALHCCGAEQAYVRFCKVV